MVEILQGVHQIDGVNANSYLVLEDDGSLTLIDTGMSLGGKKILDYIKTDLSKQPSDVKTIVLTHSHIDHIRGALAIKKASGAKVLIHEEDADAIRTIEYKLFELYRACFKLRREKYHAVAEKVPFFSL